MKFFLNDITESWSHVLSALATNLPCNSSISFQSRSILDQATADDPLHTQADLFTFIYFLSDIWGQETTASKRFFTSIFSGAKAGAAFYFIDNCSENTAAFASYLDGFNDQLEVLLAVNGKPVDLEDVGEVLRGSEMEKHILRMGREPKITHQKIIVRIYRKK